MPNIVTAASQGLPPSALVAEVEARLGRRSTHWVRPDTGLSAAKRFLVTLADESRVFVKAATDEQTESWLRNEHVALVQAPAGMAPELRHFYAGQTGWSVLITHALDGHWPASHAGVDWRDGLPSTIAAIERLASTAGADALPRAPVGTEAIRWDNSALVTAAVSAGIASAGWFAAHRDALRAAEAGLDRSGTAFVHGDMRSDNICLMPDGPRFVDWSSAACGAPETDLAAFLPAARLEGGPSPEAVLPNGGRWAAAQAAEAATMAASKEAPAWLQRVCWRLVAINLEWAVASLGLGRRDGTRWEEL